jgi:hypothetical protein
MFFFGAYGSYPLRLFGGACGLGKTGTGEMLCVSVCACTRTNLCECARTFQFCPIEEILWGILYIEKKSFVETCRHMPLLPPPPWPQLFDQPPIPNRCPRSQFLSDSDRSSGKIYLPPLETKRVSFPNALPPLPLTLPPPHRRQATSRCRTVALSRCCTAATAAPPPSCRRRHDVALTPPPQPPRCCHRAATVAPPLPLPPPQRRRQAVTNVALSRCCHSLAAAKLPPTSRFRAAATAAAAALLPPR